MNQITVKELYEFCKIQIDNGNGDKNIVISDDVEGNGYHGMFFGFSEIEDEGEDITNLFYDTETQSADDTIILG